MTTEEINEKLKHHLYKVASWCLSWPNSQGAKNATIEAMGYLAELEGQKVEMKPEGSTDPKWDKPDFAPPEDKITSVTNCQQCPFVNNDNEFGYDGCNLEHIELANNESMPNHMPHKDCALRKGHHSFSIADSTDTRWMEPKYVEFNVETDLTKIANDLEK